MRIVSLDGPTGSPPIVFHPALTVVDGLDRVQHAELVETLRGLPAGRVTGREGLVEAHGVVLDLDADSLRLLGLGREVEVLVSAAEVAAATGRDGDETDRLPADGDGPVAGLRLSHDILAHGVAGLKRSRIEFEEARLAAVEALEEARGELDPFATTAFEQAAAALRRAEADDPSAASAIEPTRSLIAERDQVRARLEELDALDLDAVLDAIEAVERRPGDPQDLDVDAIRELAEALAVAESEVATLDEAHRADGQDPAELLRRMEGHRLHIERLEASAAPQSFGADDVVELEAAHDAVLAADARVSGSRLVGKAARKALDEAVAAEAAVLARMGFPTYSAFALAQSAPGPDPETRVELETARRELAELTEAYEALSVADAHDPVRTEALARREALRADAAVLVDAGPDDLVDALTALARRVESGPTAAEDGGVDELRRALEANGVDFGDLDLSDDDVVDVARAWLADTAEVLEARAALDAELEALEQRLTAAGAEEADLDPVQLAQREVEAAEARLAAHRQASDRVAELCGLLEEIEGRLVDLGENIGAQEALVAAAAQGLALAEAAGQEAGAGTTGGAGGDEVVTSAEELLAGRPVGIDDTEWYLLTRLAALRSLSYAGSVPLVLDGALGELPRAQVHAVLDQVATMTDVVQVVYLGGDEAVVEWAAHHGDQASVVSVAPAVPA